jgi:hypothetical protein
LMWMRSAAHVNCLHANRVCSWCARTPPSCLSPAPAKNLVRWARREWTHDPLPRTLSDPWPGLASSCRRGFFGQLKHVRGAGMPGHCLAKSPVAAHCQDRLAARNGPGTPSYPMSAGGPVGGAGPGRVCGDARSATALLRRHPGDRCPPLSPTRLAGCGPVRHDRRFVPTKALLTLLGA